MEEHHPFDDIDQEIRDHIELETQDNLDRGMTAEEARTAALRRFGNPRAVREEAYEVWHCVWLRQSVQDIRYALRQLRLAPVFTITVILTLGLGIGATTAIFSLVHSVMLKPLPVADPSALFQIGSGDECCRTGALQDNWQVFSYSLYREIEEAAPQFDNIAAFQQRADVLSVRDGLSTSQARPWMGEYVSGNYFQTFGLRPFAGRLFTPEDDERNAAPVAVISYNAWQQQYNSSFSAIGAKLTIETHAFTIVGVAPPGFFGETLSSTPPEIWIPLQAEFLTDGAAAFNLIPSQAWLHLIGRLRPGASIGDVSGELTAVLQHWLTGEAALPPAYRPQSPEELARQVIEIAPGGSGIGTLRDIYGQSLRLLFGLCLAVLSIACANVANLLLARGVSRRGHIALQLALGASRRRILRQAFTESLVLGILGGCAGVAIAWLGTRLAIRLAFRHAAGLPIAAAPSLPVLGFCLALSLLTGLLFGAAPAFFASRTNPIESLSGVGRSTQRGAALPQKLLVVLQAALSVVLLTAAGMLARSLLNLQGQDLGFATAGRVIVRMEPPLADYTFEDLTLRYRALLDRLSHLPGVHNASLALSSPTAGGWKQTVVKPGEGTPRLDNSQTTRWNRVSPGYFETMGQPILQGRGILESDRNSTRGVAVVNQAFARKFFKNQPILGKHFGLGLPAYSDALEVVGLVGDTKSDDLLLPPQPTAYGALGQRIVFAEETLRSSDKWDHFISGAQLDVTGDLGTVESQIREAFRLVDPNFAIVDIQPLQQIVDSHFDRQNTVAQLSGLFGTMALLLASIGVYGVTAYSVVRRRAEIGIRMAIGADRLDIVGLVLRGVFAQVAVGVSAGIPASILLGKLMSANLYHVGFLDATALTAAVGSLLLGALAASIVPARRAAQVEPVTALRST